jgi:integrase/recombinase XerC
MVAIAPSSANLCITIIKLIFEYLMKEGYIERNPATVLSKVKVVTDDDPSEDNNDNKAYTDKEVLQLMR